MGPSMASLCSLVLALPLFASALSTLPNGYIVSLNPAAHDARGSDKSVLDAFAADAKKAGISYTVRHTFDSRKIFTGLSLVLRNGTDSAKLATLPSVDLVEPVLTRTVKAAVKKPASAAVVKPVKASAVDADGKIVPSKVPALFTDVPLDSALIRSYNPHVLTGIDKLHAQGITGKGQTVCVLDTGVDWQHPSLGGEFGGDNKVYIAWSKGSYDDDGRSIIDKDGHGTHCAGSVAANPNNYGFAGAAPDARLGGFDAFTDYKTRNADGTEQSNDAGIGAIIAAGTNDNCDVLSMSYGGQDNGWLGAAQSVAVRNAAELKFLSIAAGNDADRGLFYGGGPDVAGAAYGGAIGNVASTNVQTFSLVSEANDKIPYFTPQPFTFYGAPEQLTVVKAGSSWRDPASFVQQGYTPPAGIDPATSVFVLPVGAGVESSGEGEEGDATFDADGPGGEEAAAPEEGEAGQRRRLRSRAVSTKTGLARIEELEFKYVIFASPANQEPDFNDIKPSKGLKPLETSDAAAHALYRLAGQTVTVGNTVDSTLTTSSKKRMVDSSTYGPNWTLDAAYSTLSGVGGNIMSTFPIALGGSAFLTGTSAVAYARLTPQAPQWRRPSSPASPL